MGQPPISLNISIDLAQTQTTLGPGLKHTSSNTLVSLPPSDSLISHHVILLDFEILIFLFFLLCCALPFIVPRYY